MGISGIQHRHMVGMNNRRGGMSTVSFKYQSRFVYRFNDLKKTLLYILTDKTHLDNYYLYGPATIYVFLFYCIMICMISSLSMQIDISKLSSSSISDSHTNYMFLFSTCNTLYSSILNWAVVMLYFSQCKGSSVNVFYKFYRLAKKYCHKDSKL